jgi:hypothetical protein
VGYSGIALEIPPFRNFGGGSRPHTSPTNKASVMPDHRRHAMLIQEPNRLADIAGEITSAIAVTMGAESRWGCQFGRWLMLER